MTLRRGGRQQRGEGVRRTDHKHTNYWQDAHHNNERGGQCAGRKCSEDHACKHHHSCRHTLQIIFSDVDVRLHTLLYYEVKGQQDRYHCEPVETRVAGGDVVRRSGIAEGHFDVTPMTPVRLSNVKNKNYGHSSPQCPRHPPIALRPQKCK